LFVGLRRDVGATGRAITPTAANAHINQYACIEDP
jgi:hypothetical protein